MNTTFGIIVNKSKAKYHWPMHTTPFPKGCRLNPNHHRKNTSYYTKQKSEFFKEQQKEFIEFKISIEKIFALLVLVIIMIVWIYI